MRTFLISGFLAQAPQCHSSSGHRCSRLCGAHRGQKGMALSERAAVPTVWHGRGAGHYLVQRSRGTTQYTRAFRSQDRAVPDLAHPFRLRCGAPHDGYAAGQPCAGLQRCQSRCPGRGEVKTSARSWPKYSAAGRWILSQFFMELVAGFGLSGFRATL